MPVKRFNEEFLSDFDEFGVVTHIGKIGRHRYNIPESATHFFYLDRNFPEDTSNLPGKITGKRRPIFIFGRQQAREPDSTSTLGYDGRCICTRLLKQRFVLRPFQNISTTPTRDEFAELRRALFTERIAALLGFIRRVVLLERLKSQHADPADVLSIRVEAAFCDSDGSGALEVYLGAPLFNFLI